VTNGRQKGARGERELRDFIKSYGYAARRGQQYAGHPDAPDVVTDLDPHVFFDAKRVETLRIHPALEQVVRDEGGRGRVPVVMFKRNRSDWIAIMPADEFMKLIKTLFPPKEPDAPHPDDPLV
jgi:Holliday junction resolvase